MSRAFSMKWAWVALAAVVLAAAVMVATAPAYAYDYTVRVWGGNQGTVSGPNGSKDGGKYAEVTVEKGTPLTLSSTFTVNKKNDKYYIKGFRPGGADNDKRKSENNNESNGESNLRDAIVVNEDMDFVVAYGVAGNMVSYTLHFVGQGTGRVLADPITRYGAQGDKPVAAYEYVEGYRPLYRNITGTLKASGNDWTFEYVRLNQGGSSSSSSAASSSSSSGASQGAGAGGGASSSTTAAGAGTPAGGAPTSSTAQGAGAQAPTQSSSSSAATPPETEEILDQDTPLAQQPTDNNPDGSATNDQQDAGIPIGAIIGIVVALLAGAGLIFVLMKRRQEEDAQQA